MADDGTDGAEVFCGIGIRVIKRRAQDGGWESDVIDHRVIEGVDRLRGGYPFIAVGRLANLGQLKVMGEGGAGAGIGQQVRALARDLEPGVIAPGIREANLGLELGQLLQRALAGGGRHPLQLGDALTVGGDEVVHQLIHLALGGSREVLIHKYLANLFAHEGLGQAHGALPAVALLGSAGELGAIELEVLRAYFLRQHGRAGAQDVPGGPQLPIGHARAGKEALEVLEVGRHHIDHAVLWQVAAGEQSAGHGGQLAKFAGVIGLNRIAGGDHVPMANGQLLFQGDDAMGGYLGAQAKEAGWVEEFQHLGHVLFISAQRFRVGFLAVISLIRQAQAGLDDISNGILGTRVLGYPEGHRGADAGALKLTQALR